MAGDLTGKTFTFKIDIDLGDADSKLQQLEARFNNLRSSAGKQINSQVNLQLDEKGLQQKIENAVKAASKSSASIQPQVAQATRNARPTTAPSGGGGGGGGGGKPPSGRDNFFGTDARGDRQGGFLDRVKSVASFTVARQAVTGTFGALEKGANTILEVQNQLQQLNKVIDTSQANLEDFKKTAISTAKEYGVSTTEVLKSFTIFAQQGLPIDQVKKFGKAVVAAKNVSEFSVEDLSSLFSSASKTFSKDLGKNPQKLTDSLLAVEGKFAVTEKDLGEVITRIGPQASALGVNFHQLNALTTVMKERTRAPAEEIATALKFITKNIVDPKVQRQVKDIAGTVGKSISFTTASGDLRGAYDVLQDIAEIYPKLSNRSKVQLSQTIGETRFLSKFSGLMEGFGDATRVVNISQNAQGETLKRNEIVMQSIKKQAEKTGTAFEGVAVSIGEGLTGPMMASLKTAESLLNVLQKIADTKIPVLSEISNGVEGAFGTSKENQNGFSFGKALGAGGLQLSLLAAAKVLPGIGRLAGAGKALVGGGAAAAAGAGVEGASFVTAVGGKTLFGPVAGAIEKSLLSKIGAGAFNFFSGAALGKVFSGLITRGLGSAAVSGVIGRGVGTIGGALGSAAGPVGAVAGFLITSFLTDAIVGAISKGFLESGRERADRLGLVGAREKATAGVQTGDTLLKLTDNLDNLSTELDNASNPKKVAEQRKEGNEPRTTKEIKEDRKKVQETLDQFLVDNEELLRKTPGVDITKQGKVLFNNKDVSKDPDARKELGKRIKTEQAAAEATAELAVNLSSFSEQVSKQTDDTSTGLGKFREAMSTAVGRGFNLDVTGTGKTLGYENVPYLPNTQKRFDLKDKQLVEQELKSGAITKELVQPFVENINTALVNGMAPGKIAEGLRGVTTNNLADLGSLLDASQGDLINKNINALGGYSITNKLGLNEMGMQGRGEMDVGLAFKRTLDDIQRDATTFKENKIDTVKSTEDRTTGAARIADRAKVGDIFEYFDKGVAKFAKVQQDAAGNKKVQTFERESGFGVLPDTARSAVTSIEDFIKSLTSGVNVIRPNEQGLPNNGEFLIKEMQRVGFGAGKALTPPEINLGPNRASELSDIIAGTLKSTGGPGGSGPQFNQQLSQFLLQLSDLQKSNKEDITKNLETGTKTTQGSTFKAAQVQEESLTLIARAIESFGQSVKALDSSIQKFQMFQNKQAARELSPVTATGPLAKSGGEQIQVAIGKTKQELSPMERAQVEMPNTFKQLSKLQFQFSQIGDVLETTMNGKDTVHQALTSASTEALQNIDKDKLSEMLNGLAGSKFISPADTSEGRHILDTLSNPATGKGNEGQSRETIIKRLEEILNKGQNSLQGNLIGARNAAQPAAKQLETAISTAASLEALRKSAEEASRSLEQLDKLGGMFNNLNRAAGEGPFGRLGATGQPTMYQQRKGEENFTPIDFSNMNSFEQRRDLIRRLSSDDARRGQIKVLDQGFNPLSPLNDKQKSAQLRALDIEEERSKRGQKEQLQKEQLARRKETTLQTIGNIENILQTSNLTPNAAAGLRGIQSQLMSIGKRGEREFLTPRGDVNLQPFNMLSNVSKRIESFIPKDKLTPEIQDQLKQIQNQTGGVGGAGGVGGTAPLTQTQELSANTTATAANTAALNSNTAARGGSPVTPQVPTSTPASLNTPSPSPTATATLTQAATGLPIPPTGATSPLIPTLPSTSTNLFDQPLEQVLNIPVRPTANTTAIPGAEEPSILPPSDFRNLGALAALNQPSLNGGRFSSGDRIIGPTGGPIPGIERTEGPNGALTFTNTGTGLRNNREIPGIDKIENEGSLLYKSRNEKVSQTGTDTSEKSNESSSKGEEAITKAHVQGGTAAGQILIAALETGSKTFQQVFEAGTAGIASAIAELAKSLTSSAKPQSGTQQGSGTPGVGGKQSTVQDMIEEFITQQAQRDTENSSKLDDFESRIGDITTNFGDLQSKLEETPDLEAIQTYVNQAVQDTKGLATQANSSIDNITKQITDLNSNLRTVEAKVDSTQVLAEQSRSRGRN